VKEAAQQARSGALCVRAAIPDGEWGATPGTKGGITGQNSAGPQGSEENRLSRPSRPSSPPVKWWVSAAVAVSS